MSDTDIAKSEFLQAVIGQVEARLRELKAGYGAARDAVLSTPHVMKSKREVFGQESAYLANALALNIQEREHELRTLRGMRLAENPQRVALGCLVGVGEPDGSVQAWYLVLPVCGGMEIPCGRHEALVRVVTPTTPVAKALLGKAVGDDATLPTDPPRLVEVRVLL
jgi:transcription elongation GreA/GreB family factor